MKVFLGGTCNGDPWRDSLIPVLEKNGIEYFNPVVADWTPACAEEENRIKALPEVYELYVITDAMSGMYSIAEAVQASNKKPKRTIFMLRRRRNGGKFSISQQKSLQEVARLIESNGGSLCPWEDSWGTLICRLKLLSKNETSIPVLTQKEVEEWINQKEILQEAFDIIKALLRYGEHEGECTNIDSGCACMKHLSAWDKRNEMAHAFIKKYDLGVL